LKILQSLVLGNRNVQREQGIVLLLVLVMLLVLSGAAGWAAKAAISAEQVTNNLRSNATVQEWAELALRYCEDGVIDKDIPLIIVPLPLGASSGTLPKAWSTLGNWTATPRQTNTVPAAQWQDAFGTIPAIAPVCMIEEMRLVPADTQNLQGFLITARGFSQDYQEASDGTITSGTDAWVQSMIRF